MPQMAPMWWTSLMVFFILCFMMIVAKSYFMTSYTPTLVKMKTSKNLQKSWKW